MDAFIIKLKNLKKKILYPYAKGIKAKQFTFFPISCQLFCIENIMQVSNKQNGIAIAAILLCSLIMLFGVYVCHKCINDFYKII